MGKGAVEKARPGLPLEERSERHAAAAFQPRHGLDVFVPRKTPSGP